VDAVFQAAQNISLAIIMYKKNHITFLSIFVQLFLFKRRSFTDFLFFYRKLNIMLLKNQILHTRTFKNRLFLLVIFLSAVNLHAVSTPDIDILNQSAPIFPHMLFTDAINSMRRAESSRPYWVDTTEEIELKNKMAEYQISLLLNNDILAYYGHPSSRNMGILGRFSMMELDYLLTELAAEYEAVSGGRKVRKAFYLIYGTVWPEGEIGILKDNILIPYIEYGLENDILIIIDHQIGKYDPVDSLKVMLPFLHYPNVHLALDPEWRTPNPNKEIGHVTADEINAAQQVMEEYLINNNLPGERLLIIHQFAQTMIRDRQEVRTNFNRVRLIHCADGFGIPNIKRNTYNFLAQAVNMPIKGFKLFYDFGIPGAGVDSPLMTPSDVYALTPRPYVIMYQ